MYQKDGYILRISKNEDTDESPSLETITRFFGLNLKSKF